MSIRITLQGIPPSLNRYLGKANGQAYRKAKAEWTDTVAWMAKQQRTKHKPYEKATVRITYFFPDRRRRDPDNYCGKLLLDGLREGGIIEDDSFRHIRLQLAGECDPDDPRTEIMVEEIG
jgi:Holliday junction resolvase RusA-like endonuclease